MASVMLCLILTLIFSGSFTTATVCLNQDDSVCAGMPATVTCITTTTSGLLQWSINNGPAVYTIDSLVSVNSNETIDGSSYVFTDSRVIASANVYTSTASLNTPDVTSVQCFDGGNRPSLPIRFQVRDVVNYISFDYSDSGDSVEVTWAPPDGAGVCCGRYNVTTPNETFITNLTNHTLNIATSGQNPSIRVYCLDQLGNMGPEALFMPTVRNVIAVQLVSVPENMTSTVPFPSATISEPVENPCCGGNITFRVDITIMEPSFGNLSRLIACNAINIEPADCVTFVNCSIEDRVAYFISDGLLSFNVTLNFTDQYGITNNNTHLSQFDASVHKADCRGRKWFIVGCVFICLFIILAGASVAVIIILSYKVHGLKKILQNAGPKVSVHLDMEIQEEEKKM